MNFCCSFEDGLDLHCGNSRVADAETATTVTKHWVLFVKSVNTLGDSGSAHTNLLGEILLLSSIHGADELVKWWVQKTDGRGAAFK